MKYLYLLGSVLRSRFDKEQRKYTLSAMLMFFFSSFLMLFAASVMGSDILFSNEEEEQEKTSYEFYMREETGRNELAAASEDVFNVLFSLNNKIDFIEIIISNVSDITEKIGTRSIKNIDFMPVLKGNGDERLRFTTLIGSSPSSYYNTPYLFEQNIVEGREITEQELEEGKGVIVLPEEYGVKAGEKIDLFNEEFTVVGITSDTCVRIPSSFMESSAFRDGGIDYLIRYVDFDKPLTDKTYKAFNQAVYELTGKEIVHYERHFAYPREVKVVYILFMGVLGTIIALYSIFGIYYPTLRLCRETMPMLSVLKLCGMRMLPVLGLLVLSLFACFAVSFGAASAVLILTEDIFSRSLVEYELKSLYFSLSAVIFILVAAFAIAPPMIKMAKSQPSEEVEN